MVTNLNDSGAGSLRQAIVQSNSTSGSNEIDFAPGLSGGVRLAGGELQITHDVRIVGPGADVIQVSGNQASRVFEVTAGTDATISGLTITDGRDIEAGGVCERGHSDDRRLCDQAETPPRITAAAFSAPAP